MENSNQKLLIIGAGLCGSLLALRMAQRGYEVQLVEKRPDLRDVTQDADVLSTCLLVIVA